MRETIVDCSPKKALRENPAEVSPGARIAYAEIAANLVPERVKHRFAWVHNVDRKPAELDAIATRGDAVAKFVVVAKVIDDRFESANFGEVLFGGGHYGTEHEIQAAEKP